MNRSFSDSFPLPASHYDLPLLNIESHELNIDAPELDMKANYLGFKEAKRFPIWPLLLVTLINLTAILACNRGECPPGQIEHIDGKGYTRCVKPGSGDYIIDGSDNYGSNYSTNPDSVFSYTPTPIPLATLSAPTPTWPPPYINP
ncbi:MAG TPA: hypothetical protein VJC17_02610 [Candidatus Dojkabacteria bacterium]|nr:hypothetical protein [Candidatus Dojkabacteria bacterium]